jgi:iron complex transport system substrate-binding protein
MSLLTQVNASGAAAALVFAVWVAGGMGASGDATRLLQAAEAEIAVDAGGRRGLVDASGHFVPLRAYRRIVSGSATADSLLLALAEPDRVIAFTEISVTRSPYAYRYVGKAGPVSLLDVEGLLSLEPDLLIVSGVRRAEHVARARDAGLEVFDLGETRGLATLLGDARVIATLLGHPERGVELGRRFARRMRSLAQSVPAPARPRGMYLSVQPGTLFGGTRGTSYHDVLIAAGIHDAAAAVYANWPRYTAEQILALDPELVVTHAGMAAQLCRHPGLDRLRVCTPAGRIVEIHGALIGDPGLAMLDAAETLYDLVHGAGAAPHDDGTP